MHRSSLENVLEGIADAVVIVDARGLLCFANAAAERLFGWLRADLLGQPIEMLVPERLRERHRAHRAEQGAAGEFRPMDGRHFVARRRDGTEFHLQIALSRVHFGDEPRMIGIARDVSAQRTREEEAWDQVKRLQILNRVTAGGVEHAGLESLARAVMFEIDVNQLVFYTSLCAVTADRRKLQVVARSRPLPGDEDHPEGTALPGRTGADVCDIEQLGIASVLDGAEWMLPDLAQSPLPLHRAVAARGLGSALFVPCEPAGRVQTVLTVARRETGPFSAIDREFFRALAKQFWIAADHIRLADAQRRLEQVAQQRRFVDARQERLAVLGSLAAGVVHDIHNAITPALCLAELGLRSTAPMEDDLRQVFEQMHLSAHDVVQVAKRIRALGGQRGLAPGRRAPVDLNAIVAQVVQMSRVRWRDAADVRGISVRVQQELAADLPHLLAVESELREGLLNLTLNAIDAMPHGGDLTLRTRATTRDGQPHVIAEVVDTGVGMTEDEIARCVEPYYSTKGEVGTGLGLVSVTRMVADHGGRLDIRSVKGVGTTMALELPVHTADEEAEPAPPEPLPHGLRILVVDDEPRVLQVLARMLGHLGHIATLAHSGDEALAQLRRASCDVDLVLTDLGMPFMNGQELAHAVHALRPQLPVLLMTGWPEIADDPQRNFAARLAKPPTMDGLQRALAAAFGGTPIG